MPSDQRRIPRSYDEIVRRTVPDPDSSFRPDERQIEEADERFRQERLRAQMTDQERVLYERVADEVLFAPVGEVGFEVEHGLVTLHGSVPHVSLIAELERRVRAIEGVQQVKNRLVVRA